MQIKLTEFLDKYDFNGSIILLEGKREVTEHDMPKLVELGRLLASKTLKMKFRSGNAEGSDYYFSLGISQIDKTRLQVITPYSGHRQKVNVAYDTISLDTINFTNENEVLYQSKQNKKTEKLIDQYVLGDINKYSIKAAYIIRDTIKAIGTKDIHPATFGIFYDDLNHPMSGGTGHTMKVCERNNIPIINQEVWLEWIK